MYSTGLYDQLKSLNEGGSPPRTRINSAIDVRSMFSTAYRAYEKRHRKNAMVKGLVDGNPPWENKTKDGQRYRANFNNGEAYAYFENAMTAFYDVYSEPETYATVTVDTNDPEASLWGEKITRHFDWLQRQDDAMDYNIQLSIHDMVLYGNGPQLFLRPLDWRSSSVPHRTLYVADDTKANVADWEWCMFQFEYGVNELYDFIADEELARLQGWDVEAVKESIMLAKPTSWTGQQWNQWERWQQALRDNDIYLGSQCAKVRVVKMLFKEFSEDGAPPKVSECWVDLDNVTDKFLNRFDGRYNDMREAVCAFYYDRGDGHHQSVKGLGVKMFPLITSRMRLQLAAVDAAFATSTVFLQSNAPAGRSTLSNIQFGAFTVLPNGVSVQQANLQGVLEPALSMSNDMSRTMEGNLSAYRQRLESPSGNPPTKFQIQAQLAQSATLGKTQLARYYQQLDELYTEKFRRASNKDLPKKSKNKWLQLAIEFQKRCKDDGVPDSAWDNVVVRASRIAGQGSPFMREQSLYQIYSTLFPNLPEDGKERLVRDLISAGVGPALTNRYYNKEMVSLRDSDQIWQAQVEHGLLIDGGQIAITPQQNDLIHLTQHFGFMNEALNSLQGGADVTTVFNALVAGRTHCAQHLQRLSTNPLRKQEVMQFTQMFQQVSAGIEQIQAMLQQQAKQQAEAQQQMAQAQISIDAETAKTQNKIMMDQAKTQNQLAIRQAKAQQDMQLKDVRTAQDIKIKQAQAAQDIAHQQAYFGQQVNKQALENAGLLVQQQLENQKPIIPGQQ